MSQTHIFQVMYRNLLHNFKSVDNVALLILEATVKHVKAMLKEYLV